ncbi:hypothetical protein VKT23_012315 [Stygiomarasmius scandens]|uniref:Uncharacterized protein n=1 Tax=Marasmiellus scandens TaxID=2682957 RepID=A0ABR1JAM8_9AGAR
MDTYFTGIISVDDAEYSLLEITCSPRTPPRTYPSVSTPSPPSSLSSTLSSSGAPLPAAVADDARGAPALVVDNTHGAPAVIANNTRGAPAVVADNTRGAPAGEQSSSQPGVSGGRIQTMSQLQYPMVSVHRSIRAVPASERTGPHPISAASIPKPDGENGRPGRGGYSLKRVLNWSVKEYKRAQAFVKKTIEIKLFETIHLPFMTQPSTMLDVVRNEILKEFPALRIYEDNWATDDFIRAALKYIHSRLKYNKLKVQAAQGQAVANMQQGASQHSR